MPLVLRCVLAGVLLLAVALKLRSPRTSREALASFGIASPLLRSVLWGAILSTETILAAGVALGSPAAAYGAAALSALFAVVVAFALLRGRSGAPCGCFGSRSRVSRLTVARNAALAAAFAALPSLPSGPRSLDAWLVAGLVVALAGVAGLAVAVFALAREIGMLRLQLPQRGALEIPGEGPELGEQTALADRFPETPRTELALAVFFSPACPLCRSLSPVVEAFRRDPLVSVQVFDEEDDVEAWRALRVPGSPYAVALDRNGVVLAKGTFNSFGELESVLAAAERRAEDPARV